MGNQTAWKVMALKLGPFSYRLLCRWLCMYACYWYAVACRCSVHLCGCYAAFYNFYNHCRELSAACIVLWCASPIEGCELLTSVWDRECGVFCAPCYMHTDITCLSLDIVHLTRPSASQPLKGETYKDAVVFIVCVLSQSVLGAHATTRMSIKPSRGYHQLPGVLWVTSCTIHVSDIQPSTLVICHCIIPVQLMLCR